jgi:hypothetical protein
MLNRETVSVEVMMDIQGRRPVEMRCNELMATGRWHCLHCIATSTYDLGRLGMAYGLKQVLQLLLSVPRDFV